MSTADNTSTLPLSSGFGTNTAVTKKRGSTKNTGRKDPRGRKSWVTGPAYDFLAPTAEQWQQARDLGLGAAGIFYTQVTKRFIKKFGWDFDRKELTNSPEDALDDEDSQEGVGDEEIEERNTDYKKLRRVSRVCSREPKYKLTCQLENHGLVSLSLLQGRRSYRP